MHSSTIASRRENVVEIMKSGEIYPFSIEKEGWDIKQKHFMKFKHKIRFLWVVYHSSNSTPSVMGYLIETVSDGLSSYSFRSAQGVDRDSSEVAQWRIANNISWVRGIMGMK